MKKNIFFRIFLFAIVNCLVMLSGVEASFAQNNRLWATYYGGTGRDYGYSVATDISGNVYLAGSTYSSAGIASGGFQNTYGGGLFYGGDAFLVKFNASGSRLWATYYGGTGNEEAASVATDALGNVYLAGYTEDTISIAAGGFQNTYGGGNFDTFLVKFDSTGTRLWATYYGGTGDDRGNSIVTDVSGNVYLAGFTDSPIGIASGSFQNTYAGVQDAFLVKFNPSGIRLWATYYGGSGYEVGNSVATDTLGNVYLAGETNSTIFIASGGFQNTIVGSGGDAFLVKFDSSGTRLWATYYGGTANEFGNRVATDASGNVYLAGGTKSTSSIASAGGFQNTYGGGGTWGDVYLVKFDPSGSRLWATYYGGTGGEEMATIATDAAENIYLAGDTYSAGSVLASGGFQNSLLGMENEFMVKFDSSGTRLCATYYGIAHEEGGSIAVDKLGNVYLPGITESLIGIASGGFQNSVGGDIDAYLVKFSSCNNLPLIVNVVSTNINCNGQCTGIATVTVTSGNSPYTYLWNLPTGGQTTQIATGLCAGTYTLTVTDAVGSIATTTVTITEPSALTASISQTNVLCNGLCTGSATVSSDGGTPAYTYLWNTAPIQTAANAVGLCAESYICIITDANGCTSTKTVTITEPSALSFTVTITDVSCIGEKSGSVAVSVNGGTSPYIYWWLPSGGTAANAIGLSVGIYTISVTDANGCEVVDSLMVSGKYCGEAYLPNAFTPNSDDKNNVFLPVINGIQDFNMRIYNRWGELIFESTDINKGWDGTYKSREMEQEVYICLIRYTLEGSENNQALISHLTLIR